MASPFESYDFPSPPNYVKTPLGESIDKSTMKLLKIAYDVAEDKNVVSSPLSLMILLSLFNSGAGPNTKEEITRFLAGTDYKKISVSDRDLSERFSQLNPEALTVATKLYVSDKFRLQDAFTSAARSYQSKVDTIDFSKPQQAANIINQWADEKIYGNITKPVDADMLGSDTVAVLFNATYFKGHWHVPFKLEETKDKDVHLRKRSVVQKPMRHLLVSLNDTDNVEVELPYRDTGRIVILFPNEVDGRSVLDKALEKEPPYDVFKLSPAGADVELNVPKLDIKSKLNFNKVLPKLGVSKLFEESADGIVQDRSVVVSKAFQESFITVDEEGATAGTFTGILLVPESSDYEAPPPMKFTGSVVRRN